MEFDLIEQLKLSPPHDPSILQGIGDDCAILAEDEKYERLVTADMLLDGVHFIFDADQKNAQPLELIARKSIAASISDIAAMGGEPEAAFLSLAVPRSWAAEQVRQLFDCFSRAAIDLKITIAGGDTTSWDHLLAINVTLLGRIPCGKSIKRCGAKPGDVICVSGSLGGSLLGKHLTFTPRTKQAVWLREHSKIHAMIDISDGLLADLGHILQESEVGAELFSEQIPISDAAKKMKNQVSALEHALGDGEDFELLWTMPELAYQEMMQCKDRFIKVYRLGTITKKPGCVLIDEQGKRENRTGQGYVHQFGKAPK